MAVLSAEHFTLPPLQGYSTQPWYEDSRKLSTYPCRVGLWPVCPVMPWHYQYSFTPEWGEALSIWSKGVLNPSYLSSDSGQSQPSTSQTQAKNYTIVPLRLDHQCHQEHQCQAEKGPEHPVVLVVLAVRTVLLSDEEND